MPKLIEKSDKDDIAKRRTVMVLEVLSGRLPVSDAIEKNAISRGTYYELESRALMAMLDALTPGTTKPGPSLSQQKDLVAAEARVEKLEQDKRRLEKLLSLTKRVLDGPMTTTSGRKRRRSRKSSKRSSSSSSPSTSEMKQTKSRRSKTTTKSTRSTSSSTPIASGEVEPSNGSEN